VVGRLGRWRWSQARSSGHDCWPNRLEQAWVEVMVLDCSHTALPRRQAGE
jgi:hypothetical protein